MVPLRYLSVCSGIEAASVAWKPLGWTAVAFAEIDRFPSAVLAHHYPDVPNWGDLTKFEEWPDATVDVLVGGTPCQSFSVAGLRKGLADPRGNLALTYLAIADRYRPRWLVWENVPGVLSSVTHDAPDPCEPPPPLDLGCDGAEMDTADEYDADESHAFSCFLAGLSELGYGWAYASLDAQYAGLAQRRQRVFVVGHLGDWRRAAAVLFERESLSGHPAPRREAGQRVAGTLAARASAGGGLGTDFDIAGGLQASVAGDGSRDQSTRINGEQAVGERERALTASNQRNDYETETLICAPVAPCLEAGDSRTGGHRVSPYPAVQSQLCVRRLTPLECCRLQGFPDDYLDILYRGKPAADGPKYKALGNSFAVPVVRWIGERIAFVEDVISELQEQTA